MKEVELKFTYRILLFVIKKEMVWQIKICGGDYPLSATIISEFANKKTRGAFIAAVFSTQGFGILASSTVTMVVCAIFDRTSNYVSSKDQTPKEADIAWRLILMIGAIPTGLAFYWRVMMPETAKYY
jgi:PHS family inorganic phosphate transporter-like MFS transporter